MTLTFGGILRRLGAGALVLFLVSLIIFVAAQLLPGSPARAILGDDATPEAIETLNAQLGFDKPILERYFAWIGGFFVGDFGTSYLYQRPVAEVLAQPLANSITLGITAFAIGIPVAVVLGIISAWRAGRAVDRILVTISIMTTVIPAFVVGIVLILVFSIVLHWLPVNVSIPAGASFWEQIRYLILPALTLVLVISGYILRVTREGFVEELDSGYARAAALKGVGTWGLVMNHVARNALTPTAVVIAVQMSYLFGGGVVIEKLFNYPGMGLALLNASGNVDIPVLTTAVMIMGSLQVLCYFIADVVMVLLSPRLRTRS